MKKFSLLLLITFVSSIAFSQNCYPSFNSPDEDIYYLSFNNLINNVTPTTSNGISIYSDSNFTTQLSIGQSYLLQILSQHQSGAGSTYGVWIDYNNDSVYSINEKVYSSANFINSINTMVSIPNDTNILGKRKLRIVAGSSTTPINPCGSYNYGECEEYTIEFIENSILPSYCIPIFTGHSSGAAKIESFSFNTLHNCQSGQIDSAYIQYPDSIHTTTLEMGKKYNIFISKGSYAGISVGVKVFLDYNNDHIFGSGECILSSNESITNKLITIPFDSSFVGKRRLRVFSTGWNFPYNACSSFSTGEVEDYNIYITFPTQDTSISATNKWEYHLNKYGYNYANKIVETYDKGYNIIGAYGSYANSIYTLKTDIDGNILKQKTISSQEYYYSTGLDETYNGGSVICGITSKGSSMNIGFIRKLTACGNFDWENVYGDTNSYSYLREVYQMPDSGFIASGSYLFSNTTNDTGRVAIVRTDKDGNELWLKDYSYYYQSDIKSLIPTSDNGALLNVNAYTANANDPSGDLWSRGILTKIDSLGNLDWNLVLDTNDMISIACTSTELSDKGYITAGYTYEPYISEPKICFFRINRNGKLSKSKIHETLGYYYYIPKVIRKVNDNKFLVLCNNVTDCDLSGYYPHASVILIDSNLNIIDELFLNDLNIEASDAIINSDGKAVIVGTVMEMNDRDVYIAKLNLDSLAFDTLYNLTLNYDSLCDTTESINELKARDFNVIIRPNPTNDLVNIEIEELSFKYYNIEIYNSNGILLKRKYNIDEKQIQINLSNFPSGIYFLRIIFNNGEVVSKKLIKI